MEPSGLRRYDSYAGITVLGDMWTLERGKEQMHCRISTHPLGWELRQMRGVNLIHSQVCKTEADVFKSADVWQRRHH